MRTTNNKLGYHIINKIMSPKIIIPTQDGTDIEISNITDIELDLLLYLSTRQNAFGSIEGIYYKDLMLELNCSKQSFYNAFYGLETKGYIQIDYSGCNKNWKCTILNNIFLNEKDDEKGYFNTNRPFLYSTEFKELTLNEKKLCILLTIKMAKAYQNHKPFDVYPLTIASWLGIDSISTIYKYCNNIEKFFPNIRVKGIKGEKIVFTSKCYIPFQLPDEEHTERMNFLTHKIKYFCKMYDISYTIKDVQDLIVLMGQYASKGVGKLFSIICDILISKRRIEPALINSLLNQSEDYYTYTDPNEYNNQDFPKEEAQENLSFSNFSTEPILT